MMPGMKFQAILGVILLIAGAVLLSYPGIIVKKREKVIDLGVIQATAEREELVPIPRLIGATVLGSGVVLLVLSARK
jgi:uncharacterized membrane protein